MSFFIVLLLSECQCRLLTTESCTENYLIVNNRLCATVTNSSANVS